MGQGETSRYETGRFPIHTGMPKKPNRGSKIAAAALLIVFGGGIGTGWWFQSDDKRMQGYLEAEDPLAVPAAWVYSVKGVPEDAIPLLKKNLHKGKDPMLRSAAARALGSLRSPTITAHLGTAATDDPEPSVRAAACTALGVNGDSDAQPHLAEALEDRQSVVLVAACRAVGDADIPELIPKLVEYLSHVDRDVSHAALYGLEKFMPEGHSYGLDQKKWLAWAASKAE